MHAYLLSTDHVIQPFGRPASETPVHNRSLAVHQEQVLRDLGCTVERIAGPEQVRRLPCLLVYDDVYFTHHALARFLKAARRRRDPRRANARAALRTSALTERFTPAFQAEQVEAPGGDVCRAYDCYYLTRFDPRLPASRQADVLPVPYRMLKVRQRANLYFEPTGLFVVPISRVFMTPIRHWSAAVTANLLGMTAFFCRTLRKRPWAAAPGRRRRCRHGCSGARPACARRTSWANSTWPGRDAGWLPRPTSRARCSAEACASAPTPWSAAR